MKGLIQAGKGKIANEVSCPNQGGDQPDGNSVAIRQIARSTRSLVALQGLGLKYLGSIHVLDGIAEVFLKTYQALSPFEVAGNLPWYQSLACLKLSFYEADPGFRAAG